MTSNGRQPENIKSYFSQQALVRSSSNFNLKLGRPNQNQWKTTSRDQTKIKMLEMKTTSNGSRPQNIQSWLSQQPLVRSSSNFKLKLGRPNHEMKTTSNGRQRTIYDRRWPQNKKGNMWFKSSKGGIRGRHRGNLECGSAQPSLYSLKFLCFYLFHSFIENIV